MWGHWTMAGDICYCHDSGVGGGRVLLASDVWRPGVLPHTVPGTGRPPAKNHQVPDTSRARCHRPAGQAGLLPRRPHPRSLVCPSRFVHGPTPCIATSTRHSPLNSQPSGWRMINAQHTATHGQSTISDTPVLTFEKPRGHVTEKGCDQVGPLPVTDLCGRGRESLPLA